MPRAEPEVVVDPEYLLQTATRWRRWLKHALREVYLREVASLWGHLGVWLKRAKAYRPLQRQ